MLESTQLITEIDWPLNNYSWALLWIKGKGKQHDRSAASAERSADIAFKIRIKYQANASKGLTKCPIALIHILYYIARA